MDVFEALNRLPKDIRDWINYLPRKIDDSCILWPESTLRQAIENYNNGLVIDLGRRPGRN